MRIEKQVNSSCKNQNKYVTRIYIYIYIYVYVYIHIETCSCVRMYAGAYLHWYMGGCIENNMTGFVYFPYMFAYVCVYIYIYIYIYLFINIKKYIYIYHTCECTADSVRCTLLSMKMNGITRAENWNIKVLWAGNKISITHSFRTCTYLVTR